MNIRFFSVNQRVKPLHRVFLCAVLLFVVAIKAEVSDVIANVTQVIQPNKHYDIGQAPVESGVYFQASVYGYNGRIKRDTVTELKNDANRGNALAKELLYLFDQLPTTHTIKSATMMTMRAITAHKQMLKEYVNQKDIIDRNDRVYVAILLQGCVVLTNNARSQLLGILDEINNSLAYWREQKNHPTRYFLHKSPIKWVVGKSQNEEIKNNIKKLERLDHNICDILGRMTKHLYNFNPASSVDGVYAWIDQLFDMVACIGVYKGKSEFDGRFDEVAEKLRFKLNRVGDLKNKVLGKIAFAKKPSQFVRNWLASTLAIASL
jgi:hypothetical protein